MSKTIISLEGTLAHRSSLAFKLKLKRDGRGEKVPLP
jgi:hypothetical protein